MYEISYITLFMSWVFDSVDGIPGTVLQKLFSSLEDKLQNIHPFMDKGPNSIMRRKPFSATFIAIDIKNHFKEEFLGGYYIRKTTLYLS